MPLPAPRWIETPSCGTLSPAGEEDGSWSAGSRTRTVRTRAPLHARHAGRPLISGSRRQSHGEAVHREGHHRSRRPRAGAQAAGHVHRRRRQHRPAPPPLGDPRQLGRRGDERPLRHASPSRCTRTARRSPWRTTAAAFPSTCTRSTSAPALELILTTLHAGGKFENRNYYHSGGLHGVGASVVTALSSSMIAHVKRDGFQWEQTFARGVADRQAEEGRAGARHRHHDHLHARPADLPQDDVQARSRSASASRRARTCTAASRWSSRTKSTERPRPSSTSRASPSTSASSSPSAARRRSPSRSTPSARTASIVECAARLDRGHRRDASCPSSTASRPAPAARTRTGSRAASPRRCATTSTCRTSMPKGLTIAAEDIREGLVAILSIYIQEPQFQGQTKDRLNNPEVTAPIDNFIRTGLENHLLQNRTQANAIAERVILAARARTASRAAAESVQRKTAVSHRLNLPGKLADCSSTDPRDQRAVHRRGRLRRRLRQAGPRARVPGHPAAARQGAQRRAGVARQGARQQRAERHRLRPRLRHRQAVRSGEAALPQDLPADGRRLRRPPHLHAAAHLLLPPHAPSSSSAATSSSPSRRSTASTSARRRTGPSTTPTRDRILAAGQRQAGRRAALQGPRRDEPRRRCKETTLDPRSARCCASPSTTKHAPNRRSTR